VLRSTPRRAGRGTRHTHLVAELFQPPSSRRIDILRELAQLVKHALGVGAFDFPEATLQRPHLEAKPMRCARAVARSACAESGGESTFPLSKRLPCGVALTSLIRAR
jgi:hypothetical protein